MPPKIDQHLVSKQERIYNLTVELSEAQAAKKAVMGGHNDEIKRIQAEIKEILREDTPAAPEPASKQL